MTTRADWIKVELTADEAVEAQEKGRKRYVDDRRRGFKAKGLGTLETHVLGCLGELAVRKYEGDTAELVMSREEDKRRGYDVAGWQVRTRSRAHYGLVLNPGDSGRYLLALAHEQPRIWLAGWITAAEGFPLSTTRNDHDFAWHLVDARHLKPLPEKNGYGPTKHGWLVDPATPFWCEVCENMHPIIEHRDCRTLRPVENPARQQLTTEHMHRVVSTDPSAYLRDRTT